MEEGSESNLVSLIKRLFTPRTEHPIKETIREAQEEGELRKDEASMLLNILLLRERHVYEIMVPRTDIVAASITSTVREVAQLIVEKGHSRIPVYEENKDNIIGIVHAKDLLRFLLDSEDGMPSLENFMRRPIFIPESTNLEMILFEFRSKKVHLAICVDEYGGTSGMVTFEDVLEEIVGDIEDEYDEPRPQDVQRLEDESLLVSGRVSLTDLRQDHSIQLSSEQVETVGGYITEKAGRVPKVGEKFLLEGYELVVREADARQILWLTIKRPPAGA